MTIFKNKGAPKDRVILAFFRGYPYCTTCIWDSATNQWCMCEVRTDLYQCKWNNNYFENEHYDEKDIIKWCELPEDK